VLVTLWLMFLLVFLVVMTLHPPCIGPLQALSQLR